jgi:hypothetical protein
MGRSGYILGRGLGFRVLGLHVCPHQNWVSFLGVLK